MTYNHKEMKGSLSMDNINFYNFSLINGGISIYIPTFCIDTNFLGPKLVVQEENS